MTRPINQKCLECSKVSYPKVRETNIKFVEKPECWSDIACPKKRSYYRKLEYYRDKQRKYHRYLREKSNKCRLCGSMNKLEVHHIKPQAIGGDDDKSNLMTLCFDCHKVITSYHTVIGMYKRPNH